MTFRLPFLFKSVCAYLGILLIPAGATAQTPCTDGFAGPYPCDHIDLIAHLTQGEFGGGTLNEVWGWTDPLDGKEFVLLGKSNGVGFIDIEDPLNPVYLGTLPTHTSNSLWRTLRPYNNFLFVGSEATGHGLQVFDLTRLRDVANPPEVFTEDAWYGGFGRCHTLVIEESSGMLFACGTNTFSGGLHIVDVTDPLQPVIAGGYDEDGYTHEAQVMIYNGPDPDYAGHTMVFCYNGNNPANLTIVDATDPLDATAVSITPYPQSAYCHQGWLTPDGRYLLMNDELDEYQGIFSQTRTMIWNVEDLDEPVFTGNYFGTTPAIDHNLYIIGNIAFQSNYTAGLRLTDVREIETGGLQEVGYFDHYTSDNGPSFNGQWMSYPFFESGVIPLTDIYGGLFLVKANFVRLADTSLEVCEGEDAVTTVFVDEGFQGPVQLSAAVLPEGVTVTFSAQNVESPAEIVMTVSGLTAALSGIELTIDAEGAYFTYSNSLVIAVHSPPVWYEDTDGDGFGDESQSIIVCEAPEGYSMQSGDCGLNDPLVYPGAPGTGENVDNNCNGQIEGQENAFCADIDGDEIVTVNDIILVISGVGCAGECSADVNSDGIVSVNDLILVIADFSELCE
ncbi:MAG: choice-of-anchor B family protein [Flavobacteriales bacterium]|jgi:choice-of-anchor B domain-containing protein